jgi:hypothetical protein
LLHIPAVTVVLCTNGYENNGLFGAKLAQKIILTVFDSKAKSVSAVKNFWSKVDV